MKNLLLLRFLLAFSLAVVSLSPLTAQADEPAEAKKLRPIRALLITGGCCHDYPRQKQILTQGISDRTDVIWTVVHQGGSGTNAKIPLYENENWADGFDVVVHNECFAGVRDKEWVERILKPHREGVPAVLIHCAAHSYRTGDDKWFEFVGVQSPRHGAKYAYTVENKAADHPAMRGFGDSWTTPNGELYHTIKQFDTCKTLATANRKDNGEAQICVWTNEYGKGRVFGTTIGHHNETMADPKYLDLITRGILWAVGREEEAAFTEASDEANEKVKELISAPVEKDAPQSNNNGGKCCGDGNVAFGQKTTASSEETGKNNFARHAVDGDLSTRWCANGSAAAHWQVELETPADVKALRIHWEKDGAAYQYTVDASADGKDWETIVDHSKNEKKERIVAHKVDAKAAKFFRVNFIKSSTGSWGSIWEFEATESELPELPKSVSNPVSATSSASVADVKTPEGFDVTMFGAPPEVNYPVCLTAAPTGEVFVGVDPQGSLGKEKNQGKVLRCIDTTGDGKADKINVFAEMDHPRGLVYDNGTLWVLHPPFLTVYHDDNLDGVADRHETLIEGISTDQVDKRGADHTTNGIRMGIDGWIYIAVGDFGFTEAKGTDGTVLSRRGGGIVRVRPDGKEMEIFCWGLRNILDVSIDPYMNVFTRDNTNDGGGWDIRVTHILQTANYGYPSLYKNFSEEIMPPLANYGGGSGCGTMYFFDKRWPEPYGDSLLTCDWGRSEVYIHDLPQEGATFSPHQDVFLKLQRPTDIDVDGSGRMYVSSWKNGKFNYSGPDVGYVARVTPTGFVPKPFPVLSKLDDEGLVALFSEPSAVYHLHTQREILRRGDSAALAKLLTTYAGDEEKPLYGRVAAIFTLKQLQGKASTPALVELAKQDAVREFALKALTDRTSELEGVPTDIFVAALKDPNPRVRAQAIISLQRLGKPEVAEALVSLTSREETSKLPMEQPLWNQPDAGRVIPLLAVRTIAELGAADVALAAIDGPHADGALWSLKYMHNEAAVNGLLRRLSTTRDNVKRREILTTLIRLYHVEGPYTGGWWGTRPDTTGPYFDRQTWEQSERIGEAIKTAFSEADEKTAEHIKEQLAKHKVQLKGLSEVASAGDDEQQVAIKPPVVDPSNPNQIANLDLAVAMKRAIDAKGDAAKGQPLFKQQNCIACHTYANGQTPKGPHLVDIGKRYKREELVESVLKPSEKIAQGFDTEAFLTLSGKSYTGFVVTESSDTVIIRGNDGISHSIYRDDIDVRKKQELSMMPKGLVDNLTPEELADLLAYLESLK